MSQFHSPEVRFFFAVPVLFLAGTALLLATAAFIDGVNPNSDPAGTLVGIASDQPSTISAVYFGSTAESFQQPNCWLADVHAPADRGGVNKTVVDSSGEKMTQVVELSARSLSLRTAAFLLFVMLAVTALATGVAASTDYGSNLFTRSPFTATLSKYGLEKALVWNSSSQTGAWLNAACLKAHV
jgi:hypothetical protein